MKLSRSGFRAALEVDQRPVHRDLGQPGQGAEHDLLDARLGGGGERDRVPVAAEAAVHPEDVDHRLGGRAGLLPVRLPQWPVATAKATSFARLPDAQTPTHARPAIAGATRLLHVANTDRNVPARSTTVSEPGLRGRSATYPGTGPEETLEADGIRGGRARCGTSGGPIEVVPVVVLRSRSPPAPPSSRRSGTSSGAAWPIAAGPRTASARSARPCSARCSTRPGRPVRSRSPSASSPSTSRWTCCTRSPRPAGRRGRAGAPVPAAGGAAESPARPAAARPPRASQAARATSPRGIVRRLDVERAAPGGPDPGGGRAAAGRVGEDGQPLGRRRHPAPDAGSAGGSRRCSARCRCH